MPSVSIRSFAKINLFLAILGLRPDGFHDLETIMQNISLADDLALQEIKTGVEITSVNASVPVDDKNICFKAASMLIDSFKINCGIKIFIKKNIPLEAGLGGGSSNGAAVLAALNNLWGLKLSDDKLISFAAQIGSDVPFFIAGGKALCKGRGEIIQKLPDEGVSNIVLIKPDISVPTKWAYQEWDKTPHPSRSNRDTLSLRERDGMRDFKNDLEAVVIAKYPIIGEIKADLINLGCTCSMMTGSGSAVFGIAKNKENANDIYNTLKNKYGRIFLVETVNKGFDIIL